MVDGVDVDAIRRQVILDRESGAARERAEVRFLRACPWLVASGFGGLGLAAFGWVYGLAAPLLALAAGWVLAVAGTQPGVTHAERVERQAMAVSCPMSSCGARVGERCAVPSWLLPHPERVQRYRDARAAIEAGERP